MEHTGKHLRITECRLAGRKTSTFGVYSKHDGSNLGGIHWYGAWRCYVFEPQNDTVWSHDCLSELAEFIKEQMDLRRPKKKEERMFTSVKQIRDAYFPNMPDCPYCNGTGIARDIPRFKRLKRETKAEAEEAEK